MVIFGKFWSHLVVCGLIRFRLLLVRRILSDSFQFSNFLIGIRIIQFVLFVVLFGEIRSFLVRRGEVGQFLTDLLILGQFWIKFDGD